MPTLASMPVEAVGETTRLRTEYAWFNSTDGRHDLSVCDFRGRSTAAGYFAINETNSRGNSSRPRYFSVSLSRLMVTGEHGYQGAHPAVNGTPRAVEVQILSRPPLSANYAQGGLQWLASA